MFKQSWSSLLPFSWSTPKEATASGNSDHEIPKSFTIQDPQSTLYNISMNDSSLKDEFVDISYRKLSYAEVAALSSHNNPGPSPKVARVSKPKQHRVNSNQYQILATKTEDSGDLVLEDDIDVAVVETIKSNHHFSKKKQLKKSDKSKKRPSRSS